MDAGKNLQTNNTDGTRTDVGTIIDVLSGKAKPTVNFETSISKDSIIFLAVATTLVGLLLIFVSKRA